MQYCDNRQRGLAHHWTRTAEVSRILAHVDQENLTRLGKPNTGSTCFWSQAFVSGSATTHR